MPAARERIVGWYSTGPKIRVADLEINEVFKKYVKNPVFVIIDVQPHDDGIPTDAYVAVEEVHDVRVRLAQHKKERHQQAT
jgi:26S proteasome regulatory subunit N8